MRITSRIKETIDEGWVGRDCIGVMGLAQSFRTNKYFNGQKYIFVMIDHIFHDK